jgi:hypothetical protein
MRRRDRSPASIPGLPEHEITDAAAGMDGLTTAGAAADAGIANALDAISNIPNHP